MEILTRLVRIGRHIPTDVALGDPDHRHFVEPADTTCLTRVANGINAHLHRNLDWIHLAVPRDRHDAEYFKPLVELACPGDCEVHLGLVHITDGAQGTERRIATARDVLPFEFGVATECGFGRRPPGTVPELLRLHAEVADPWE